MNTVETDTQAGGVFEMYIWGLSVWWFVGVGAALVVGATVAAVIILRRRKKADK